MFIFASDASVKGANARAIKVSLTRPTKSSRTAQSKRDTTIRLVTVCRTETVYASTHPGPLALHSQTELGEYCSPWWGKVYSTQKDEKWFNQDFCFISCDPAVCPGVPRHETTMLWRAKADKVKICYSHEACGSVDYMTGYMESCKARGGSIVAGECSCDLRHPPQSCTGNLELKD